VAEHAFARDLLATNRRLLPAQVAEWQAAAGGVAAPAHVRATPAVATAGDAAQAHAAHTGAAETEYAQGLAAELAGVPFSAGGTMQLHAVGLPASQLGAEPATGEAEAEALTHVLLPRKKKELYKAMQMGKAKKDAASDVLRARKAAAGAGRK
jgi:hypothetical protein